MTAITEARDAYLAARDAVRDCRLALGHAIADARAAGAGQADIARALNLTREQIRRYEVEWRETQR